MKFGIKRIGELFLFVRSQSYFEINDKLGLSIKCKMHYMLVECSKHFFFFLSIIVTNEILYRAVY